MQGLFYSRSVYYNLKHFACKLQNGTDKKIKILNNSQSFLLYIQTFQVSEIIAKPS